MKSEGPVYLALFSGRFPKTVCNRSQSWHSLELVVPTDFSAFIVQIFIKNEFSKLHCLADIINGYQYSIEGM
jgi:hypothetical protein